jgi:ABC-type branched-subunit amino acid transport system ATPase component
MSKVALRAAGLTKRYGRMVALDGLDLEVGTGEVHAFVGPNGAARTAARSACWAATLGVTPSNCTGGWRTFRAT